MVNESAVLAWKFPVMNGIVCEGERVIKWEVPQHPSLPTGNEITQWRTEYDEWVATIPA